MAKNSHIEWTHHTFNPWWGCIKISPACDNCYAELWAKRMGHQLWGRHSSRRFFGAAHWREPLSWNEEARVTGRRERVFCASMADVFERRADLNAERLRLWNLIENTPNLDWLLLTKRPQNIRKLAPWREDWPANVWLGTTVENQTEAEKRLPSLLSVPAVVRFLSCQPLLGPLNLRGWFSKEGFHSIDWIIAGGESGGGSRPVSASSDQQKSRHDHHAAGDGAPVEFFVEDDQAEDDGDDRGDERDHHRLGDVHVVDQPVVKQKRDHRSDDGQIKERDDRHRGPVIVKRIAFDRNADKQQRDQTEEHLARC